MKRLLVSAAVAGSLAVGGCTTDPYANHQIAGTATGAAVGAGVSVFVLGGAAGLALLATRRRLRPV